MQLVFNVRTYGLCPLWQSVLSATYSLQLATSRDQSKNPFPYPPEQQRHPITSWNKTSMGRHFNLQQNHTPKQSLTIIKIILKN